MSEFDLEYLLGGFATNTLTEAEHQALFKAAMVNQRLFDLLADEQALKELLDDPAVRRRLLQSLKEPQDQRWPTWGERALAWIIRPETLTIAGSVAALALATVLGIRFFEDSQRLLREDQTQPSLSQRVTQPTVRSKLGSKPSAPSPPDEAREDRPPAADKTPPEDAAREDRSRKTNSATEAPIQPAQSGSVQDAKGGAPPRAQEDKPKRRVPSEGVKEETTAEQEPAPSQLPPVVLPRVPTKVPKSRAVDTEESLRAEIEALASKAGVVTPAAEISGQESPAPDHSATAGQDSKQSGDKESASPAAEPVTPTQPAGSTRFTDNLRPPAAGNARSLFLGRTSPLVAGLAKKADSDRTTELKSEAATEGEAARSATPAGSKRSEEAASGTPQSALGIRFHRRPLPLQGSAANQLSEGLSIPQLTIEVNQPGHLYVITSGASGEWTVLAPAATARKDKTSEASAAKKDTPYHVLLVGESGERASHPSYLVFSRSHEPILDQALALATAEKKPEVASAELEALLLPWIKNFPTQSLKTEQVSEQTPGMKSGTVTYVADGSQSPSSALLYRLPTVP